MGDARHNATKLICSATQVVFFKEILETNIYTTLESRENISPIEV